MPRSARVPERRRGDRARAPLGWRRWPALTLALASALGLAGACTQRALVGREDELTSDAATPFDVGPFDGLGFVDGRLHAHAVFNSVDRVLWFGGDADPSRIELYIYEDMPTCEDVSKAGWLTNPKVRPADLMGITVGGTTPGSYKVVAENPPLPGNAYVLHVIDQADPVIESEGQSGTIVITKVEPDQTVVGGLEVKFSTGSLVGEFNATWCPTGVGL
jgi:hypothetical protein